MPRRPAVWTEADIARVIRAARKAGAACVEIGGGDATITVRLTDPPAPETPPHVAERPPIVL